MLAALITLTSQVPVMTFFPGILSVFLAYLYTWYCFLAFFSLKSEMQTIPLEAIYSGLGYTWTRYLHCRYLKQIIMGLALTK